MIAELHNKISLSGSNLNDRLEDQLTGDFFGTLRYVPFEKGLQKILGSPYVFPNEIGRLFRELSCNDNGPKYSFWKRLKDEDGSTVEPDLIIDLNNGTVVCIEVKYNSGLSSDDPEMQSNADLDELNSFNEIEISKNQLARESRAMAKAYKGRNIILLFVARAEICDKVYKQSVDKINADVTLARLSWSDIYEDIIQLETSSTEREKIVFQDIRQLLARKGFDRFKNFNSSNKIIDPKSFFTFDFEPTPFQFQTSTIIKGDLYYEFRK